MLGCHQSSPESFERFQLILKMLIQFILGCTEFLCGMSKVLVRNLDHFAVAALRDFQVGVYVLRDLAQ